MVEAPTRNVGADLTAALIRLAVVAEEQARVQAQVAAAAWDAAHATAAMAGQRAGEVLALVTAGTARTTPVAGELRRVWVRTLAGQGMSGRQIAERLGVSHQRVSVLLAASDTTASRPGRR